MAIRQQRSNEAMPKVEFLQAPDLGNRLAGTRRKTVQLLVNILAGLDFGGAWTCRFKVFPPLDDERRFVVCGVDAANGIRVQTQPGEGSTRWEGYLVPPSRYNLNEVVKALRTVPPQLAIVDDAPLTVPQGGKPLASQESGSRVEMDARAAAMAVALGMPYPPIYIGYDTHSLRAVGSP